MEAFKINILEYDKIKEIHVLYKENLQDIFESDRKNEKLEGIRIYLIERPHRGRKLGHPVDLGLFFYTHKPLFCPK